MSVGKYDVLRFLRSRLGTDNAWASTKEIADHLQITTDVCAKLIYAARTEKVSKDESRMLIRTRSVRGVKEHMVTDAGILRTDRATRQYAPIRDAKQIQVPVVVVRKPEAAGKTEDPVTIAVDVACPASEAEPLPAAAKCSMTFGDIVARVKSQAARPFEIPQAGVVTLPEPEPAVFEPDSEDAITEEMHRINAACVANIITNLREKLHALRTVSGLFSGRFEVSRTARVLDEIAADLERVAGAA